MVHGQVPATNMNSIVLPAPAPALKLIRPSADKWTATLADERRRLLEDQEALRVREENLRRYEDRLRALQSEIEAGRGGATAAPGAASPAAPAARSGETPFVRPGSRAPFGDEAALQAGWGKLHRAREILEAEQNHLKMDRLAVREQETVVKRREAAVAQRELLVAAREAGAPPAARPGEPVASEHTLSAVTRLTSAPFNLARSMWSGRR